MVDICGAPVLRVILLLLCSIYSVNCSACHNSCSNHGRCTNWLTCECFEGYEGNDCSRRMCPKGPQLADIPHSKDSAHALATCSGQGTCDYNTGACKCNTGFSGYNCARTSCYNDCSGHGLCLSLGQAATFNDGYMFNRTTKYTQWDSDVFFGCRCDPGYSGADCSQRECESGIDPRLSSQQHETVTLVCKCTGTCTGKFKLQFMGHKIETWLKPTSKGWQLADAIMKTPGIFAHHRGHVFVPVSASNTTQFGTGNSSDPICQSGATTRTEIMFTRNPGDLPALSFYANLISGGSLYFETTQTLVCDCQYDKCNGTFRLSFDSEMSGALRTWDNGVDIVAALSAMSTVQSAGITVINGDTTPICLPGSIMDHRIIMQASFGNLPRMGLYSSVVQRKNPRYYNTSDNTTAVLSLRTDDGRDDHVKLCNGIGKCDFSTGICKCPFGWTFDADIGPCGKLEVNTSSWGGLARCPGVVPPASGSLNKRGQDIRTNYNTRIYVSINPTYNAHESTVLQPGQVQNETISGIYYYEWMSDSLTGPRFDQSRRQFLLNMSTNVSAGPLVMDTALDRLYYVDCNPAENFIGIAPLRPMSGDRGNNTVFAYLAYKVYGLAFDAHFNRRNLYWSVPAEYGAQDGQIYFANVDSPDRTIYSLVSAIGQTNLVDPKGLAIHYTQQKLYWVDRDFTEHLSVLNSCDFDGSDFKQVFLYRDSVNNHTVSANVTDLIIDIFRNNTAFFLDASSDGAAIVASNLDSPIYYNNATDAYPQFKDYYPSRIVLTTVEETMVSPRYLALDEQNQIVLWSDPGLFSVGWTRYKERFKDLLSPGTVFTPIENDGIGIKGSNPYYVVGMTFDRGLGAPQWGRYLDCYGNGVCLGLEGNYVCQCNRGFYGDCQARTCPKARAWFQEPVIDEVAHDVDMECSNMGLCDRATGLCTCRPGFEGPACERLTCQGGIAKSTSCNGNGRCRPLRHLARHHKNEYNELSPVGYGIVPHSPTTWDADRIHGCLADEYGYSENAKYNITTPVGSALNINPCPKGYNKRLLDQIYSNADGLVSNYTNFREVQQLNCLANAGNFTMRFRDQMTEVITTDYTSTQFQNALQALSKVGKVEVRLSDGADDLICNRDYPRAVNITFLSEFGKVPLLQLFRNNILNTDSFGSISIVRVQEGTEEGLLECSGHGDCDTSTGLCKCYDYYSTSDGAGNPGTRGDCGHHQVY